MKINKKSLIINIIIPLAVGGIAAFLTTGGVREYTETALKPPLTPPPWIFPVVWTILYILMGISAYLVMQSGKGDSTAYSFQLFVNFLWPLFFFNLKAYLFSFVLIVILIAAVAVMIRGFYKADKRAAYLQIPYLVWLLFATYLNIGVYILN